MQAFANPTPVAASSLLRSLSFCHFASYNGHAHSISIVIHPLGIRSSECCCCSKRLSPRHCKWRMRSWSGHDMSGEPERRSMLLQCRILVSNTQPHYGFPNESNINASGGDDTYCGTGNCQQGFGLCSPFVTMTNPFATSSILLPSGTISVGAASPSASSMGVVSPDGSCGGLNGYICIGYSAGDCCSNLGFWLVPLLFRCHWFQLHL